MTGSAPADKLAPAVSCGPHAQARQLTVEVLEHQQLARDTWRLRLLAPELAHVVTPGQFFMLRGPQRTDPLLGRPFALYDTVVDGQGKPVGIDIVYLVVGKMTRLMSSWKPGDMVEIWGPLGHGFPLPGPEPLLLVAGGIGQTPFLAVARQALGQRGYGDPQQVAMPPSSRVTLCYGVRSAEYLAGMPDFEKLGLQVQLATDDGSRGHHGYVTELLRAQVERHQTENPDAPPPRVYACGPEPMLHAVIRLTRAAQVPCWVSLESPMACGFGACFSCVTKIHAGDGWDYRRVCVEGPIFPADEIYLPDQPAPTRVTAPSCSTPA